jgi:hypothetical protein
MRSTFCFTSLLSAGGLLRATSLLGVSAVALLSSGDAAAHFKLINPPSAVVEDAQGNPQKTAPCGGDTATATGVVTTVRVGDVIPVQWQETIGHSGHWRISIVQDRDDLIDPPVVTSNGDGVSGNSISAEIQNPVQAPVLLDGLFPRETVAAAQTEPFTQNVTVPNMPCEKCTLQVIQFMSQHGPGYFYHHCADIRIIAADAELPAAGGAGGAASASSGGAPSSTGGSPAGGSGRPANTSTGGSANTSNAGSANTSSAGAAGSSSTSAAGSSAAGADVGDDADQDDGGCAVTGGVASSSPLSAAALALVGLAAVSLRRRSAR